MLRYSTAKSLLLAISCLGFFSCQDNYTPKPRGYFRIDFPKKQYQQYQGECPFSFEFPVYAEVKKDASKNTQPCWINVEYGAFRAKLHLSYKEVTKDNLNSLIEDSRMLVYKHTVKADAINESVIKTKNNVSGIFYALEGSTASAVQFYLTDSTRNFIRGSLYFYTVPRPDSLAPVITFLKKDITHMIDTFRWTGK